MTIVNEILTAVTFEGAVPSGIVWQGRHYRVTDTPTRLDDLNSHRLSSRFQGWRFQGWRFQGWRFQGTGDDAVSYVFDIVGHDAQWRVDSVYA